MRWRPKHRPWPLRARQSPHNPQRPLRASRVASTRSRRCWHVRYPPKATQSVRRKEASRSAMRPVWTLAIESKSQQAVTQDTQRTSNPGEVDHEAVFCRSCAACRHLACSRYSRPCSAMPYRDLDRHAGRPTVVQWSCRCRNPGTLATRRGLLYTHAQRPY
jgi:hypothetical protein